VDSKLTHKLQQVLALLLTQLNKPLPPIKVLAILRKII
jgi:hypothetical protein